MMKSETYKEFLRMYDYCLRSGSNIGKVTLFNDGNLSSFELEDFNYKNGAIFNYNYMSDKIKVFTDGNDIYEISSMDGFIELAWKFYQKNKKKGMELSDCFAGEFAQKGYIKRVYHYIEVDGE